MTITPLGDVASYNDASGTLASAQGVYIVGTTSSASSASAGIYRRAAAVSATAGDGVIVTGVTTAGTVTYGLANGGTVVVSVPLGSTILPLGVISAALTTAVGGTFQSLFFT